MDFPALFSLVHILTARWQHCLAPKLKKERARTASRFEVGSIREHTLRHLYTKNINSIFTRVIHGTTSAHYIVPNMVEFYRHFPITAGPLSSADMADGCLISLKWCFLLPPSGPTPFHAQWARPVNCQNREIGME
jgi:hypothetical protein